MFARTHFCAACDLPQVTLLAIGPICTQKSCIQSIHADFTNLLPPPSPPLRHTHTHRFC